MSEKNFRLIPGSRLSFQEVSYLKTRPVHERLPFLRETCLPTLNTLLYRFSTSLEEELMKAHRRKTYIGLGKTEGTNPFVEVRNHVLFIEGPPGTGKSYLTRHTILPFLRSSAGRWKETYGIDVPIIHLHWDHIEEILTEQDIIAPEAGKPFSKRELEITGVFVNLLTAYKLKKTNGDFTWEDIKRNLIDSGLVEPKKGEEYREFEERIRDTFNYMIETLQLYQEPSLLVIEKPGPTALKYALGWGAQTRHYNSRMIDDLHHANPDSVFQNIDRDHLVIGAVGIVPGPNMNALVAYRAELQKTHSWQDPETDDLNRRYGLSSFTSESEWKAARVGANLAIMKVASNAIRIIVSQMLAAAQGEMLTGRVSDILPPYIYGALRNTISLIKNAELFVNDLETTLNARERQEWEDLKQQADSASSYFDQPYPLMLLSSCFDLATGLVMDNNFGAVDFKTVIRNNPDIHPTKLITVPLIHQQVLPSGKIYP